MTKPSNQKKVLELVKNDIVSIDEALTLTDEETVFCTPAQTRQK